jgi:hypothetical protein
VPPGKERLKWRRQRMQFTPIENAYRPIYASAGYFQRNLQLPPSSRPVLIGADLSLLTRSCKIIAEHLLSKKTISVCQISLLDASTIQLSIKPPWRLFPNTTLLTQKSLAKANCI